MSRNSRRIVAALAAVASLAQAYGAGAAGLFLTDRGVRPMGRGGAFVAGADDPGAIFYNPAGIALSGRQLLFDATWVDFTGSYTRKLRTRQTDPNTGQPTGAQFDQTFATVHPSAAKIAIPTLAYTDPLGTKHFTLGLGVGAPYAASGEWPSTVDGRPAPQRYSLLSTSGSVLVVMGGWLGWKPSDSFALGAGVEALAGSLATEVVFSSCPQDRLLCAQEQRDYDTGAKLKAGPIFTPSGNLGVIWAPGDVRLGASFQLPYWIHAPAKLDLALPDAPTFYDARQSGRDADVDLRIPWNLRVGAEYRGFDRTRVELAWVLEHWSMHDRIDVTPKNIQLVGVQNFPESFALQPISLQRHFRDSLSVRLGGEHLFDMGKNALALRAGVMYERSAVPPEYLSAASFDVDKVVVSVGAGFHTGHWRLDALLAEMIAPTVEVGTGEAAIVPTNPVKANPPEYPYRINGGTYRASATLIGVGLSYTFDRPRVTAKTSW